MPSSLDINNFKYICIHKNIAKVRGFGTSIILDIQSLLDFIINFFEIEETIKIRSNEELINNIGKAYCDKINESFLFMVTSTNIKNKNKNFRDKNHEIEEYLNKNISEKDFRKKFIDSFGFIDHKFFDNQIHEFCCEEMQSEKNFNPNIINIKKFVDFSYNFLFLYMLKNYQELGIMLDNSSNQVLNELYHKIKNQIFHTNNNKENINKNDNIFATQINNYNLKSMPMPEIKDIKNNIFSNDIGKEEEKINTYALNKTILGSIKINEEYKSLNLDNTNNNNNNYNKYKTIKSSIRIINTDPIEAIPLIYNICVKYIINLFKLERVSFNLLKGIGVCKIFRDHLIKIRGKNEKKIHWMILIQNLESIVPEVGINFLKKIALDNKDNDGNINLQFYFSKIEQILLQYCLSLEDDKLYAKYYI